MRVNYKETTIAAVDAAILQAERDNQSIDNIELTEKEWVDMFGKSKLGIAQATYRGVKLLLVRSEAEEMAIVKKCGVEVSTWNGA